MLDQPAALRYSLTGQAVASIGNQCGIIWEYWA